MKLPEQSLQAFISNDLLIIHLTPAQSVYNSNSGGGSGMDWIEMRFAEVVLNLAECANETGRLAEAKDNVRRIRQRAGIAAGSFDYGLAVATDMASMRSLILNERMIEFAMEGKRYWDLRRTRNYGLISARQPYKLSAKLPISQVPHVPVHCQLIFSWINQMLLV